MPLLNLLATDGANIVDVSQFSGVLDNLTSQINVGTVVGVISATIGAGIGLVFMWFGVKKLVGAVMTGFTTGRLKIK